MQTLNKFLFLLKLKDSKGAFLMLVMMLITALLDMIGVASILPFIAVLVNPDIIQTNFILKTLFDYLSRFGVENNQHFLFALGVIVFVLLIISLIFKALATYVQIRFVLMREYIIGKHLVEGYLHQPYSWFLNRNSAVLGKTILSEVAQVVIGLMSLMDIIAKSMIVIVLVFLLVLIDPKLALSVSIIFGAAYGIVYYFTRRFLKQIGKVRLKNNQSRFMALSETFGAAKEVKLSGLEQNFIKKFSDPAQIFARSQTFSSLIGQLPRFFIEGVAFGGILVMILYLMMKTGSFNNSIPIISLYTFAGYRLMPAIQAIYVSFTRITYISPSLDKLYDDIKSLKQFSLSKNSDVLPLDNSIALKNINYNYPETTKKTLKNINLFISAKTTVGFVGTTGSGKTTTADIILGLLEPQEGSLEVDGQHITNKNLRSWQKSIGYVPQHIYLSDDTVAANIAFGIPHEDINYEAVERASKIANLYKFVTDELPRKFQTKIGENGVRLSGGQRQRIGIARALYNNPQVLVLDEATSALDNLTEKLVMDAINNLNKKITIILVAHRLNTVRKCDNIFLFEKGELINNGKFEDLKKSNDKFRNAVNN